MHVSSDEYKKKSLCTEQGILADILSAVPAHERQSIAEHLRSFFLVAKENRQISFAILDFYISAIDEKLSNQVNAIMHNHCFKRLESVWGNVNFLIQRVDFTQNILVEIINISKEDLLRDFEDSVEVTKSGLFYHIYISEFGQFGGQPVAAIIADYSFSHSPQDVQLLQYVSSVAAMAHAPFFAGADKDFFGIPSWSEFAELIDLRGIFDSPTYDRWKAFRENPNARYVGLILPSFLLRRPYSSGGQPSAASFNFDEDLHHEGLFSWGNSAFAFAVCLADSFARYRWCVNIIGPDGGGMVKDLPYVYHTTLQGIQKKISTRTIVTEKREFELSGLGFISLCISQSDNVAIFNSANAVLKAKTFPKTPEGAEAELGFRLSTQFPYMMLMNRLAHYIKVLQRENMGSWREKNELSKELNAWLSQYVTAMDTPDAYTRSRRPLRMAEVHVKELDTTIGWYSVTILAKPHFKYMGVNFTLSLEGKLERQAVVGG